MSKKRIKSHHCANCSYKFRIDEAHNNYCPNCGQENHNPRLPLLHYITELAENLFHLDNKTWISLRTLLFKPGTLSKDHINNKRQRYTPPFRMFILSLAVFIIFLEAAQDTMVKRDEQVIDNLSLHEQMLRLNDTSRIGFSNPYFTGDKIYFTVAQLKELEQIPAGEIKGWLKQNGRKSWFIYQLEALMVQRNISSYLSVKDFNRHLVRIHYRVILIMVPISAFLIYLGFYRTGRMYYDALITSVHLYVFGLIAGTLVSVAVLNFIRWGLLKDTTVVLPLVMLISLALNFIPAYKKIYEYKWPSTIGRGMLIGTFNMATQIIVFWLIAGLTG